MQPATRHQEQTIATLAGELAEGPYAADASAFLAAAGVNLDTRPRLIGVSAARLPHEAASGLIGKLLRLAALSQAATQREAA